MFVFLHVCMGVCVGLNVYETGVVYISVRFLNLYVRNRALGCIRLHKAQYCLATSIFLLVI